MPALYRNFGEPDQEEIPRLSAEEARELLPQLAEGSMRPKIEAALAFGRETLLTNFEALDASLAGRGGTRIG